MWMRKLVSGVLCVMTPLGPRYINPSFRQRILLLWIFRHFDSVSRQVLSSWQQRLVNTLYAENKFVSLPNNGVFDEALIIGTIEWPTSIGVGMISWPMRPSVESVISGQRLQER
jgi:hypothetical protein